MSNQNALYEITTRMEKEDYRKLSYLVSYKNKQKTVLLIIILAAAGAGIWAMMDASFSVPKFLVTWLILIVTAFAAIFLKLEYKAFNWSNQVRAGLKGARQEFTFYDSYLIAAEDKVSGTNKIKYDKLSQVLEAKDFFIIYASANSASMIRKKDIDREDLDRFGKFLRTKMGSRYQNVAK